MQDPNAIPGWVVPVIIAGSLGVVLTVKIIINAILFHYDEKVMVPVRAKASAYDKWQHYSADARRRGVPIKQMHEDGTDVFEQSYSKWQHYSADARERGIPEVDFGHWLLQQTQPGAFEPQMQPIQPVASGLHMQYIPQPYSHYA